jgi:hypothetical protein
MYGLEAGVNAVRILLDVTSLRWSRGLVGFGLPFVAAGSTGRNEIC